MVLGGDDGIAKYYYIAFAWPGVIGLTRLTLMLVFFWNIEAPIFYIGKNLEIEDLRKKFRRVFSTIYAKEEVSKVVAFTEKAMKEAEDVEAVTFTQLFTKKHRLRFFVSVFINVA